MKAVTLLTKYAQVRSQKRKLEDELSIISQQIQAELIRDGLKSIATADGKYVATRAKRQLKYVDQTTALDYLWHREDLDPESFMQLNDKKFINFAETELKQTGELIPGISVDETEYVVVRENKEK